MRANVGAPEGRSWPGQTAALPAAPAIPPPTAPDLDQLAREARLLTSVAIHLLERAGQLTAELASRSC